MKKMRKLAGLLLAMVMVLSVTMNAFAADTTYSITIKNDAADHTYEAYQIFTGDLSEGVLSNIQWGSNVTNASDLGDAAAIAERLDTNYQGEDKLTVDGLLEMIELGGSAATSGETSNPYVISGLKAGYYLVKDLDGSLTGKEDAYTEYIVKVVEDVETEPKSDVPEVIKKVKDTNDTTGETTDWQDSADYDIGDAVPFQLTATLANNVSAYDTYKIVFHDTLSDGLTYNEDAKVMFGETDVTEYFTITEENGTLTISCDNVKKFNATNSSVITVEYTATLNENAILGAAGNPNEVYLEYSNNPNWNPDTDGDGDVDEDDGDEPTGKTPEDVVIVFTYKVKVDKVDENTKPLSGATFTLEKFVKDENGTDEYDDITGTWTSIDVVEAEPDTTFTFKGLDDGIYRLTETVTPAGYNTIDPIYFTVEAEHVTEADLPTLTKLNGEKITGEVEFTTDLKEGSLSTTVVNETGATLPETGGIGTTIFYVVGAVLVLGAAVLLITKKRMSAE